MANCGCSDGVCNCIIVGTGTNTASNTGNTWFVNGAETVFLPTSSDGTISAVSGGSYGHSPDITLLPDPDGGLEAAANGAAIKLDPNSTAPVSLGPDGLRVDCCGSNWSNSVLTLNPDIYLRFGESLGVTAENIGALPPDGTYNNGFTLGNVSGVLGDTDTSVDLDGLTAFVQVPYDAGFNNWTNVTVHALVNLDSAIGIDTVADNLNGNTGFKLFVDAGNVKLTWGTGAGTVTIISGTTYTGSEGWAQIVAKLGPTTARLYVDGVLVASNLATTYTPNTSQDLFVGALDGSSEFLDAQIDEFIVWPIALSDANIQYLYEISQGINLSVTDTNTIDLTYSGLNLSADVIIDPASTATVTTSVAGLRINDSTTVSDTATVDLTKTGNNITADVIPNTSLGMSNTASGIAINIQGSPTAITTTTEDRLRFNLLGELTYLPDGSIYTAIASGATFGTGGTTIGSDNILLTSNITNTRQYAVYAVFSCDITGEYEGTGTNIQRNISTQFSIVSGVATTGTLVSGIGASNHTDYSNGTQLDAGSGRKVRFRSTNTTTWALNAGQVASAQPTATLLEALVGFSQVTPATVIQAVSCRWELRTRRI